MSITFATTSEPKRHTGAGSWCVVVMNASPAQDYRQEGPRI